MNNDQLGNLTTIIKILIMTIAPTIAIYLGVDQDTIIVFLTALVSLGLAVLDAKYPNTIFKKEPETLPESQVLNPEYECDCDEC